ncbi:MAG TPA: hypothetical protein PKD05_20445, partial [Candidatus Melainabacteria bacterium]|nr:hypothetical protein [Candidatus Melainabacteria bacterium]
MNMVRRARNLRLREIVLLLALVLSRGEGSAFAAAPELKPVLKPIDPSMAKLDTPEPEPAPQPKEDPAAKYNREHPLPSGSYGMSGGGNNNYQPAVDPNDRRNQVFT